jgi:prepilin-type processing-associated H-X9-DG protein
MYTYANENNDYWPIAAPFAEPTKDEFGAVKYVGVIGKDEPTRGRANDTEYGSPIRFRTENNRPPQELSTTRNLWVLIRNGASASASFICPSGDDEKNDEDNPQNYWDFGLGDENNDAKLNTAWYQCSYGYQVPYGKFVQPHSDRQQDMPLVADKGPFSGAYEAGLPNPGVPAADNKSGPLDWAPWNSPNHGGEGQNVLFADSHVEFFNKPIVGVKNDNIYTRWSSPDAGSDANILQRIQ